MLIVGSAAVNEKSHVPLRMRLVIVSGSARLPNSRSWHMTGDGNDEVGSAKC